MQGASRAFAPAGTPIKDYKELKKMSVGLRKEHLRDSAAGSRYVLCLLDVPKALSFTPTVSITSPFICCIPPGGCTEPWNRP